ncbi:IreB family regulatory phosphoprotein [Colibacter massiliensis]
MIVKKRDDDQTVASMILEDVYHALKEKGYNPISQIAGYLLSGDPTYITSHNNARGNIRRIERDELVEELLSSYVKQRDL